MRGYKASLSFGLSLLLCMLTMACSSGKPPAHIDPLVISTTPPPSGFVGVSYTFTLAARGGVPPYSWSISTGSLPPGVTLNAGTGMISGTPTSAGSFPVTVQCTDVQTPTAAVDTRRFTITIASITPLSVTTTTLAAAVVNQMYNATLSATGGLGPYTWSLTAGTLPAGLTLSSRGAITGTATALGTSTFTVQVTDSEPTPATVSAVLSLTVNVNTPVSITTTTLPPATVGLIYSGNLVATGGVTPYSWQLTAGTLPAGLNLSPFGIIFGTPTTAGSSSFTVQVKDSTMPTAQTATAQLTITVSTAGTLLITTTSLPDGAVGVAYSQRVTATGGTTPYTWAITAGALPPGLSLNSTSGIISGTPTTAGLAGFTMQVTDAVSATATADLSINVPGALSGNYAFSFNGFNAGSPVFMAGHFFADGNGNITSGVLDLSSASGTQPLVSFTGTNTLNSTSRLGQVSLNAGSLGAITWQLAQPATASTIRFIQNSNADGSGTYGSGVIEKQDTTAFSLAQLAGDYVFSWSGVDSTGARLAQIGTYSPSQDGMISTGSTDINDAGTLTSLASLTGNYTGLDSSTGRGVATFLVNGVTSTFTFYVVTASELFMVQTENTTPANLLVGSSVKQAIPNTGGITLGGSTVLELNGIQSATPDVMIGHGVFTAAGSGSSFTLSADENVGGALTAPSYSGNYSVDPSGRVTLSGTTFPAVMYLTTSNEGFVLGTDSSVKSGVLEAQVIQAGGLSGTYLGGSVAPVLAAVINEVDSTTVSTAGTLTSEYDTSGSAGSQQNQQINATYTPLVDGRAEVTNGGSTVDILYAVAAAKFVEMSTDANPKLVAQEQ